MTNKQPSSEQLREFWEEWCGFIKKRGRWQYDACKETNYYWEAPDGRRYKEFPALDLNNLFKYAVPKLRGKTDVLLSMAPNDEVAEKTGLWHADLLMDRVIDGWGDTPALALFWALWQVKEVNMSQNIMEGVIGGNTCSKHKKIYGKFIPISAQEMPWQILSYLKSQIEEMGFARVDIEGKPEVGRFYDGYLACKEDILALLGRIKGGKNG